MFRDNPERRPPALWILPGSSGSGYQQPEDKGCWFSCRSLDPGWFHKTNDTTAHRFNRGSQSCLFQERWRWNGEKIRTFPEHLPFVGLNSLPTWAHPLFTVTHDQIKSRHSFKFYFGGKLSYQVALPTQHQALRKLQGWASVPSLLIIEAAIPCCLRVLGQHPQETDSDSVRFGHRGHVCVCVFAHLCPTLWGPMGCSPPDSSVCGTSQARILGWVAISFSRESSPPRDWTHISCIGRRGSLQLSHLGCPWRGCDLKLFSLAETKSLSGVQVKGISPHHSKYPGTLGSHYYVHTLPPNPHPRATYLESRAFPTVPLN